MTTVSAGLDRYPELLFALHYTGFSPYRLAGSPVNAWDEGGQSLHSQDIPEELERFKKTLRLEGIEILYLCGTGLGYHYEALKSWLKEKRERRLIFLEDDLPSLHALLAMPWAETLLHDPQVILHYISDSKLLMANLEELVAAFPCDCIEVACIEFWQKKKRRLFQKIQLKLLRQSAIAHALLTETLYSHKMLENLLSNIRRWHGSFFAAGLRRKFRGIPAVICGAGPSLQNSLPLLKTLEDRALILAGGSTIAALSNQGVQPHLGLALDPNAEEFDRMKIASAYETPLIYATRLQPDIFNAVSGEWGYLVSDTGGPCERYFEQELELERAPIGPELGSEALSVTTLAIALAVEMGCNPILLCGIDLAYTGLRRYAEGIVPSSQIKSDAIRKNSKILERHLLRKDIHGHFVHTLLKWVMESDCIASFAKAHPQTRFINVSAGGIGFSGIPNLALKTVMEEELSCPLDLRALVHAQIQQLKMPPMKDKIALKMQAIQESLVKLGSIAGQMLEELARVRDLPSPIDLPTGRMTILEIDFQEEIAFECLFPMLGPALDKLLSRAFFSLPGSTAKEQQEIRIASKIAKWTQWKEMIESERLFFEKMSRLHVVSD